MPEKKIQILALDDEALNNDLLRRTFRPHTQYELQIVTTAAAALDHLASGAVTDILLCDQSMPVMSGTEFVREMLQRGFKQPVILVTAFPEMSEVIELWEQGLVRGIVPKPWRALDLVRTVDRFTAKLAR